MTLFEWSPLMALKDAAPITDARSRDAVLAAALVRAQSAPRWQERFFREFTAGRFIDAAREEDGANPDAEVSGLTFPILYRLNYDTPDLRAYAYCVARLVSKETAAEHQWTASVLEIAMAPVEGCIDTTVAHWRRAIELEPTNMGYMAGLLDIHGRVREDVLSWYDVAELTLQLREMIVQEYGISLEDLDATELDPSHPLRAIQKTLRQMGAVDQCPERLADLHARSAPEGDQPIEDLVSEVLEAAVWANGGSVPDSARRFIRLLLRVHYAEADELAGSMDVSAVRSLLDAFSYEALDIRSYAFWAFRLIKHETARDHHNASRQIRLSIYKARGAPETGLFHARRAMELSPGALEYKRQVLAYYGDVSEQVLSRQEAMQLAREVLVADPEDRGMRTLLCRLESADMHDTT